MRRSTLSLKRTELLWAFAGILIVQLAIGAGLDRWGQAIRDPEYDSLFRQLKARQTEAPGKPLALALGSSRTQMGLDAGSLSEAETDSPLVFNFAIPGSGPMLQQITLRRLREAGVRPDVLVVEALPVALSRRGSCPLEERLLDPARLSLTEALQIRGYYHQSYKLWGRWLLARTVPTYRHHAELRDAIGLDVPISPPQSLHVDDYGWLPGAPVPPDLLAKKTEYSLGQYATALNDFALGAGPSRAMADLLEQCHQGPVTVLVMPPEGSVFRAAYFPRQAPVTGYFHDLADRFAVPCFDARTWVADRGFRDGHHLSTVGARVFTQRFGREVLVPLLRRENVLVGR